MTDLDLVAGVLAGESEATAAFAARFSPELRHIVARLGVRADAEELVQRLLVRLLVGSDQAPAKLASYRGEGSLQAWVRAVSARFVIDHVRHLRAQATADRFSEANLARSGRIEGGLQQRRYAALVRSSVERAFGALGPRERNLLRYAVFHRLTVDELGAMYGVHRATAARWLQRTRDALHDAVAHHVCAVTGMPDDEARSLVREVGVETDVSLRSVLSPALEDDAAAVQPGPHACVDGA